MVTRTLERPVRCAGLAVALLALLPPVMPFNDRPFIVGPNFQGIGAPETHSPQPAPHSRVGCARIA